MDCQDTSIICCESFPISPKSAIFFHRFPGRDTDSIHHADIPNCSIHSNTAATVQCIDCAKNCFFVRYSYHCSKKCFLDAWTNHVLYHEYVNVSNPFNEDSIVLRKSNRCNSWSPIDMVSYFDERVELVLPTGRKWVNKLGPLNALVPFSDHIGFSFKLQSTSLCQSQAAKCAVEIFVTDPIIQRLKLSPRSMSWLPGSKNVEKFDVNKRVSNVGKFSILTYNILSDIYAYVDKYSFCPDWALAWEYRRKNLLHEMILYDADILCLQEVQSDHFENFFKPELESFGYSAVFKKKTKEFFTGSGYTIDGCAIFFRNEMFQNAIAYELEYSKTALSLMGKLEPSLRDQARVRLIKDNVALVVILEVVGDSAEGAGSAASFSKLCVVNTHVYAGKGFPDVKLLQVSDLVSEIEKIIDPRTPLLVCGDINSFPGSDPYVLLTKHEVNPARAKDPLCIYQHLKLRHSMKLASAYAAAYPKLVNDTKGKRMIRGTGEPLFTSLTPFHGSTLDYIFYSEDSLEVEGLLELPNLKTIGRALPTPLWSSDHIALMGSFRITRPYLR